MSGGSKKQTVGYRYYLGLHMGLCAGPIDALLAIKIGDREAWTGTVTASGQITIDKPDLFGGEKREGGVQGAVDVMMGESTQVANTYLSGVQTGDQPAYRGLLGLVFRGGLISANNPYIKPWAIKARRILQGWQGGATWYSAKAEIMLPGGDKAMNPAHIVYECLTNGDWGMGYGTSLIDDLDFKAAADVFFDEGLGLCMQWMRQQPIEGFVQIVCDHAGMNLGQDRRTGLFVLRLLRGGYDIEALPVFDESNIISLDSFQRPAVPEQVNEVTVKFEDVATGQDGSVTVQNLANITSQGGVVTQSRPYPGLPTAELALRVALRDLRVVSSPLAKARITMNRAGYNLLPGDLIRLSWAKLGIVEIVLRVLQVNAGTLTEGAIVVDAAEDVFELPATTYGAQQPTGWTAPNNAAAAATKRIAEEAGYYEIVRELGTDAAAALADDAGFIITAAGRPTGDALDYGMHTRTGADAFVEAARGAFCPTATLTAALAPGATSATLTTIVDGELITAGMFAQIDDEIVRIDTFDSGTGAITMGRGVMGTVAAAHASAAVVFFRDGFTTADETERIDAEEVDVKMTPATGLGELAIGSAPTDTVTLDQRAVRPYPPGRVRISGAAYPLEVSGNPIGIAWSHRDRLQQNLEGDESTDIGPEAGTTYGLELRHGVSDSLIASSSAIAGTSYTAPTIGLSIPVRLLLWSERDGFDSAQRHDWTFDFDSGGFAAEINLASAFATQRKLPPVPASGVSSSIESWRFLLPDGDYVTIEALETWNGAIHVTSATITRWNGESRSVRYSATLGTECTGADYDPTTNLLIVSRSSSGSTQGWILDMDVALTDAQPSLAGSLVLTPQFFAETAGTLPFGVAIDETSAYLKVLDGADSKIRRINTTTGAEISAITSAGVVYGSTVDFDADATSLVHFDDDDEIVVRDVVTMAEDARWTLPAAATGRAALIDGEVVVVVGTNLLRYSKAGALLGTHGGVIHQNSVQGTGPQKFGRYLSAGCDPITVYDTLDSYAVVPDIFYTPP